MGVAPFLFFFKQQTIASLYFIYLFIYFILFILLRRGGARFGYKADDGLAIIAHHKWVRVLSCSMHTRLTSIYTFASHESMTLQIQFRSRHSHQLGRMRLDIAAADAKEAALACQRIQVRTRKGRRGK